MAYLIFFAAIVSCVIREGRTEPTERPVAHFCQYSGDLVKVFSDTLEQFKKMHKDAMEEGEGMRPFSMGNTTFTFPFATIHDGELHNAMNLYIDENSKISCDGDRMNVLITFGIRDAIITARFTTPFGVDGDSRITLSHFEAEVRAHLPMNNKRVIIEKITIKNLEGLHVEVVGKTAGNKNFDFSSVANTFLKSSPKATLFPMIEVVMRRFAQQYLDENPLPF